MGIQAMKCGLWYENDIYDTVPMNFFNSHFDPLKTKKQKIRLCLISGSLNFCWEYSLDFHLWIGVRSMRRDYCIPQKSSCPTRLEHIASPSQRFIDASLIFQDKSHAHKSCFQSLQWWSCPQFDWKAPQDISKLMMTTLPGFQVVARCPDVSIRFVSIVNWAALNRDIIVSRWCMSDIMFPVEPLMWIGEMEGRRRANHQMDNTNSFCIESLSVTGPMWTGNSEVSEFVVDSN